MSNNIPVIQNSLYINAIYFTLELFLICFQTTALIWFRQTICYRHQRQNDLTFCTASFNTNNSANRQLTYYMFCTYITSQPQDPKKAVERPAKQTITSYTFSVCLNGLFFFFLRSETNLQLALHQPYQPVVTDAIHTIYLAAHQRERWYEPAEASVVCTASWDDFCLSGINIVSHTKYLLIKVHWTKFLFVGLLAQI